MKTYVDAEQTCEEPLSLCMTTAQTMPDTHQIAQSQSE